MNKPPEEYLFSWENVPGKDSDRLLRFLRDNLDIGWVENAEICKSPDGRAISISKNENSAEIIIDEKKKKANLKICDGRTYILKVKKENGTLNIYKKESAKEVKEAIKTPLGTTILFTIIILILLIVLTIIKDTYLEGKTIDYSIIFLALVPFLIYLAVSGKISEIGGGGFGIKFNKVSEANVSFKSEGTVAYVDEAVVEKMGINDLIDKILPEIAENPRSTLNLKSREYEYYTYPALKRYLEELTRFDFFKYVLFVDENDLFNGYVYARSLLAQLFDESRGKEIVENINKWNLDKIIGFKKYSIKNYQSNRGTLRIMEGEGITDIAVVDKDMKFKGFTNREMITSRIVNNLMIKAE